MRFDEEGGGGIGDEHLQTVVRWQPDLFSRTSLRAPERERGGDRTTSPRRRRVGNSRFGAGDAGGSATNTCKRSLGWKPDLFSRPSLRAPERGRGRPDDLAAAPPRPKKRVDTRSFPRLRVSREGRRPRRGAASSQSCRNAFFPVAPSLESGRGRADDLAAAPPRPKNVSKRVLLLLLQRISFTSIQLSFAREKPSQRTKRRRPFFRKTFSMR